MLNALLCIILFRIITIYSSNIEIKLTRDPTKHIITYETSENKSFKLDFKQDITANDLLLENTEVFFVNIVIGSRNETVKMIPNFQRYYSLLPCGLSYYPKLSKSFNSLNISCQIQNLNVKPANDFITIGKYPIKFSFLNEEKCYQTYQSTIGSLGFSLGNNDTKCKNNLIEQSSDNSRLGFETFRSNFKDNNIELTLIKLNLTGDYDGSLNLVSEITDQKLYNYCDLSNEISLNSNWHCKLKGIFLIDDNKTYHKLNNSYVIFNPSYDHIRLPLSYYSFLLNNLKNCEKTLFSDGSMGITCKNDILSKFPELGFNINNWVYRIQPSNLFWKTNSGYVMKILFTSDKEIILGLPFLKQYESIYDFKKLRIGLIKNSNYISHLYDLQRSYLDIFIILFGVLFSLIISAIILTLRTRKNLKDDLIKEMKISMIKNGFNETRILEEISNENQDKQNIDKIIKIEDNNQKIESEDEGNNINISTF